jgi:ABC-2 type transport system ATP-binding protein
VPRVDEAARRVTLPVEGGRAAISAAVRAVDDTGAEVDDIGLRRPTLDEVFLTITGQPMDSGDPEPDTSADAA